VCVVGCVRQSKGVPFFCKAVRTAHSRSSRRPYINFPTSIGRRGSMAFCPRPKMLDKCSYPSDLWTVLEKNNYFSLGHYLRFYGEIFGGQEVHLNYAFLRPDM
jgi:hypothetical protein